MSIAGMGEQFSALGVEKEEGGINVGAEKEEGGLAVGAEKEEGGLVVGAEKLSLANWRLTTYS